MPDQHQPGERTTAQRRADHAGLARLSDTLVPALVAKLTGSGLGELEVREGDWKIRVRRPLGSGSSAAAGATRRSERPRMGSHAYAEGRATSAGSRAQPGVPEGPADNRRAVATSPAVGVFRPGLAIGASVHAGDRIAIVDLLGIPQDVSAPIDGTLVEIFVQAGEAVEYGEEIGAIEAPAAAATASGDDVAGATAVGEA